MDKQVWQIYRVLWATAKMPKANSPVQQSWERLFLSLQTSLLQLKPLTVCLPTGKTAAFCFSLVKPAPIWQQKRQCRRIRFVWLKPNKMLFKLRSSTNLLTYWQNVINTRRVVAMYQFQPVSLLDCVSLRAFVMGTKPLPVVFKRVAKKRQWCVCLAGRAQTSKIWVLRL